jgi:hypothetical protein
MIQKIIERDKLIYKMSGEGKNTGGAEWTDFLGKGIILIKR